MPFENKMPEFVIMNPHVPFRKQVIVKTVSVAYQDQFLRRRVLITLLLLTALYISVSGQTVTEIITDYNGYWKSGNAAISAVKPDNSHNMLAFTHNGTRYSTGVNDALLNTRGDVFTEGDYRALPVSQIGGANSNTKIGLGAMYDGVYNGASNPRPANNPSGYLTDGINGLNLGTGVANLPAGQLMFAVTNMQAQLIGDGIPDLLITQIADPSGAQDSYEFADVNGNRVGNTVDVNLSTLPVLGNWTADFYDASTNPLFLGSGFTQTDRGLRLWSADFSAFGINATNVGQVVYFRMRLSGNSDIAFVAYNNKTFSLGSTLPTKLAWFKGKTVQEQVTLSWQTVMEQQLDRFVIESSYDGQHFFTLDSVKSAGYSFTAKNYSYTQRNPVNGKIWYRLKQIDINGTYEYSTIIAVNSVNENYTAIQVYPNPVSHKLIVKHKPATGQEQCTIRNMQGVVLMQQKPATGSVQSSFDVQQLPAGTYLLVVSDGKEQYTEMLLKK